MKNNKKGSTDTILLVILIILVCAVGGYLIWSNMSKTATTETAKADTNVTGNNVTPIVEPVVTKRELSTSDSLVSKLYGYIPNLWSFGDETGVYSSKSMTINDIEKTFIVIYAFRSLGDIPDSQKGKFIDLDGNETDNVAGGGIPYSFDASILTNRIKELYNISFDFAKNEVFKRSATMLRYINGKFSYSSGGGGGTIIRNYTKLLSAYEEGENLYITDKSICLYEYYEDTSKKAVIYNNSYDKNVLKELDANACAQLEKFNKDNNVFSNITDYMFSNYDEYSIKYLHTFKKNENGQYYWYSTQPMK